jgi:hypothetical protein
MVQYSDGTARAEGLWVYKNGGWYVVGNEAAGLINHILNPGFEVDASGWATYADAAAATPVDGTGGSPSSTLTRSTSSPLRNVASGLWSKSAADRQGEGFSYDFLCDNADQGKMQQISFDYTVTSNFVDGDMRVYVYDVTNSLLIEPSQRDVLANSGQASYLGYFQASSNSTSYRLIIHTATTSALAYDLKIDNVLVGPIEVGNAGTFVSDWQSYTPTLQGFGSTSNMSLFFRRVGENLEVEGSFTTGTGTGAEARVGLPSGLTSSSSKIGSIQICGVHGNAATSTEHGGFVLIKPGVNYFNFGISATFGSLSINPLLERVDTAVAPNSTKFSFSAKIPIQGWSTGVSASEIPSGNTIAFKAEKNATQTLSTTPTKVTFQTSVFDSSGSYDVANNRFVAPESGFYQFQSGFRFANHTTATEIACDFRVNNVLTVNIIIYQALASGRMQFFSPLLQLNKGDYVEVFANSGADASWDIQSSSVSTYFAGYKINNPAQIAPTEVVAASYETNAGQSLTTTTITTILYEDKIFDTHNSYNVSTGEYTVPISGIYRMDMRCLVDASASWTAGERAEGFIYVNGTLEAQDYNELNVTGTVTPQPNRVFYVASLNKGDVVTFRVRQNSGATVPLIAGAAYNQMSIERIK